ncbi:MAG: U32 family peptidase, partial [Bacteroidales bacterium]|nr:U32 family peptidase [Bacteroidales bacterium]
MQLERLELLSPARDRDIGIAAVNCGADAVYIAGPSFGARESAANSIADIAGLVKYAHRYRVKIYMVINTILYEDEIDEAVKLSRQGWDAGCDALIIQDLGLLKADLPPVPLFASTQTNMRTVEDVLLMESLGFERVILARELSLSKIKEIRAATKIQLESFVHGSLCVGYSGQCYLSQYLAGRSANRGVCAQPCRSLYNLIDINGKILEKNKPLLSLKDLNLSSYIPVLAEAGITSFKIEGRLKNASYVKNIVRYYRSVIDRFIENNNRYGTASHGSLYGGFTPAPEKTFNRGYTTFFSTGKRGQWNSTQGTKSTGEYLGIVKSGRVNKRGDYEFQPEREIFVSNNDGLCFVTPGGKITGAKVSGYSQELIRTTTRTNIPAGSSVYRNFNHQFEKELLNLPERLLKVSQRFICKEGVTRIEAVCEDGTSATYIITGSYPEALNSERAKNLITQQLAKRAGIYLFEKPLLETGQLLSYPVSVLNSARRSLAQQLERATEEEVSVRRSSKRTQVDELVKNIEFKPFAGKRLDYSYNISNPLAGELYITLGAENYDPAYELNNPEGVPVLRSKYCIRYELGLCNGRSAGTLEGKTKEAL